MGHIKNITFNGETFFKGGEHTVRPLSWRREVKEQSFGGLNGAVSLDLGRRKRKLTQRGRLAADSKGALIKRMEEISEYIDGQVYELVDQDGIIFSQVRMDSFTRLSGITVANQAGCEYEIEYTQLSN